MFYYRAVQYNRCLGLYFILPSRMLLFSRIMWKAQEVLCISGFVTHHLPIFHHANHKTTGAQGNEIGDWLSPAQKQTAHSDAEFEAQQYLPMQEQRTLVKTHALELELESEFGLIWAWSRSRRSWESHDLGRVTLSYSQIHFAHHPICSGDHQQMLLANAEMGLQ